METQVINPLVIHCKSCGGDQQFDIVKQQYACTHCGSVTEMDTHKAEFKSWRQLHFQAMQQNIGQARSFACPQCGAHTLAAADDASMQCPFCQSTMVDATFDGASLPEVILPFKITQKEAEDRLKSWLTANSSNPAAQAIEKNMHRFQGCYLPYHIVRGAVGGEMSLTIQSGEAMNYPFKGYFSHTAVNASKDWNNLFLDGIEPFDFNDTRAFDFRYLNGQKAKIQNVGTTDLEKRILEETKSELYDNLSKKARTKEVSVLIHNQDTESIATLLPVYMVQCEGGIAAAVNGQTGKVSIATGKRKNLTGRWWLMPLIATLVVSFIIGIISGLQSSLSSGLSTGVLVGMVFGAVFFVIANNRHRDDFVDEIITEPQTRKSHNDTRTEFFADFGKGTVPVKIKFFTLWRIVKTVLITLAIIFLPVLIAIPIQFFRGLPIADIKIGYGAAWYIIPGFFAILSAGGLAKAMMYGFPLYEEILPNGKTKRRKASSNSQRIKPEFLGNFEILFATKKNGCLTIGITLFLLIGSIAAML